MSNIWGLKKGNRVLCISASKPLIEGKVYSLTYDCIYGESFLTVDELPNQGWFITRFINAEGTIFKQGDKLLCIEGNEYVEEGRTYTFDRYTGETGKQLIRLKENDNLCDINRFIVIGDKGII